MYWRVHWRESPPFAPQNAKSLPWGLWDEPNPCPHCHADGIVTYYDDRGDRKYRDCPHCGGTGSIPPDQAAVEGYSCCPSPEALVAYFESRGHPDDDEPVVVFAGEVASVGTDGEPLVVPRMQRPRPRWLTYGQLRRAVERRQQRRE